MILSFAVFYCLFLIPKSGLTEYVKICLHLFAGSFEHFGDLWVHNPWMVDGAGHAWPGEGKRAALLYSGYELGNRLESRLGNRLGHRAYRTDTSRQIKSCLKMFAMFSRSLLASHCCMLLCISRTRAQSQEPGRDPSSRAFYRAYRGEQPVFVNLQTEAAMRGLG